MIFFSRSEMSRSAAFGAGHHAVDGLLQLEHGDGLLAAAGREQRALVHHVRQVRAGEAWRSPGDDAEIHGRIERLALGVDPKDALAPLQVGPVDHDLPVESPGPQ